VVEVGLFENTPMSAWTRYNPSEDAPWNLQRAHHLHRRASFGATWPELQRDLADDPQAAVTRLLDGQSRLEGVPSDFEQLAGIIGQAAADSSSPERLKAWWLYRCLFSPHPLQERLALLWHNHFATSNLKVDDLKLMKRQNDTLRKFAAAKFGDLLQSMAHDPALLNWLDAPQNRKGHSNENLARELMELFTLGIGHYTEDDVKEAARALTGWTVKQGEFANQTAAHDDGEKEILGRTGKWSGDDLVDILLTQPATARRLAWRLSSEFFGEGVVDDTALTELADGLRQHDLDIHWAVETILRSELFFSPTNIGSRICDPVSLLIGRLQALECWRQTPSTLVLAEWVTRMGQDLFYPPNVGGWSGGRAWLSTRTTIARTNCMAALVTGSLNTPAKPPDLDALAEKHCGKQDLREKTSFFARLFYGREISSDESLPIADLLSRPEAHLH
jgi:uncharacterized protein (DUF1800 family)